MRSRSISSTPARASERTREAAKARSRRLLASSSWQRATSSRSEVKLRRVGSFSSASRCSRLRTIPWVIRKRERSVSGGRVIRRWNVSSVQETSPFSAERDGRGRFPFCCAIRRAMTSSGACATTLPGCRTLSARRARDLLEVSYREEDDLPAVELREPGEENGADRDVHPTPRVSVPAITRSSPCWASCSTSSRYFRQEAGVMDADAEGEEAAELLAVRGVEAHSPLPPGSAPAPPGSRSGCW